LSAEIFEDFSKGPDIAAELLAELLGLPRGRMRTSLCELVVGDVLASIVNETERSALAATL
jgi:hypothetical protein